MMVTTAEDDHGLAVLGLNDYEARAYRALVADHPATAYRLGKQSGVPLSRVYEVVGRLVEKGFAVTEPGEPLRYRPVPPDEVIAGARSRTVCDLQRIEEDLAALYSGGGVAGPGWVRGHREVTARLTTLAAEARTDILAAASAAARGTCEQALAGAGSRVHTTIVPLPSGVRSDAAFAIVVDGARAMVGRLGDSADALCTEHPVIVRLCTDYLLLRSATSDARDSSAVRTPTSPARRRQPSDWLDWEEEKQLRLLHH